MRELWPVLVVLLAACGAPMTGPPTTESMKLAPASTWRPGADYSAFPVDRTPRPIVLLDKLPSAASDMTVPGELPTAPPTMAVNLPDKTTDLPLITASQALQAVPKTADGQARVMKVELATAKFRTDRGEIWLPVWRFHAALSFDWPALDPSVFWQLGKTLPSDRTTPATIDGQKLTVSLRHTTEPCPGQRLATYQGAATESPTSVMVHARPDQPPKCAPGKDTLSPFTITLAQPLGNRVLVDGAGVPIPVVPAGR